MASNNITVTSPANIAFIKYWGQRDSRLTLPTNDSFSMNLSACTTEVILEPVDDPSIQDLHIKSYQSDSYRLATHEERERLVRFHQTACSYLNVASPQGFRVHSANTFPQKAGIASSASFFSAMAMAFALCYHESMIEDTTALSVLARLSGSGSACRSVPDGFVWWHRGTSSEDSYAESVAPSEYWDLRDLVVIGDAGEKTVSSHAGHQSARSSPFYQDRLNSIADRAAQMKQAFMNRDFEQFGSMVEQEAMQFHAVMMTQQPPLLYWSEVTIRILHAVHQLRQAGTAAYATIDAGAHVHVICQAADHQAVSNAMRHLPGVTGIISNEPSGGTRLHQ